MEFIAQCGGRLGMKSLSDLNILPLMDTSTHDLSTDFFTPLLSNSIRYDRGVGYFSSGRPQINSRRNSTQFVKLRRFNHTDETNCNL